jgi:hypothetical protein
MHRAIAAWLTERPWRSALAAAFCGAFAPQMSIPFVMIAGAIPVLIALRFDARQALITAATAAAATAWILLSLAPGMPWLTVGMVSVMVLPVLLALLLKRTGSLNLCFQLAVAMVTVALIVVHLLLSDPAAVWVRLLDTALQQAGAAGLQMPPDTSRLIHQWARTMWGGVAALALAAVLAGLFLGCWWQTLLEAPGRFGAEYRQLRLGAVLGIAATALFIAAFATDSALAGSLAWVAFAALSFQGLAAAHRSKAGGRLTRGWLAAIYVLLIVPLSTSITVVGLAIWGFADNWLRPRAQAI